MLYNTAERQNPKDCTQHETRQAMYTYRNFEPRSQIIVAGKKQ
jgi:hypothetical protein